MTLTQARKAGYSFIEVVNIFTEDNTPHSSSNTSTWNDEEREAFTKWFKHFKLA